MKKVLLVDNYDSFTYNLVQILDEAGAVVTVVKNDAIDFDAVSLYDKILLSPGPGLPVEAGKLLAVIREFAPTKSILGVCLGHQAIAEVFGGTLVNLHHVYHGIRQDIEVSNQSDLLFKNLTTPLTVGLYHSWAVATEAFPDVLEITAFSPDGVIMALRHRRFDVCGVQFHPESYMTPQGSQLLQNWLRA